MKVQSPPDKLKLGLGCSLLILVLLLSASEDRFLKVLNRQSKPEVVHKLELFRKNGIERTVPQDDYNPEKAVETAVSFLGAPSCMGGSSHKGIDCSGLVMMAHRACNIELPHSAEEQARYGKIVPLPEKLQKGDLVFFYDSYTTPKFITHSGIYLGENEFIHTSSAKGVVISRIDDPYYWGERFLFGTRLQ